MKEAVEDTDRIGVGVGSPATCDAPELILFVKSNRIFFTIPRCKVLKMCFKNVVEINAFFIFYFRGRICIICHYQDHKVIPARRDGSDSKFTPSSEF